MSLPPSAPTHLHLSSGQQLPIPGRTESFRSISAPMGTLIVPSDFKGSWAIEERVFRSLLLSPEGEVLSSGFPKFANLQERGFADHYRELQACLRQGKPVGVGEKLDGSLIIRSVVEGEVLFRTRGAWGLGKFQSPVLSLVRSYPLLLDPSYMPTHSLLFEFCSSSPKLRVVLAHQQDSLTLLGAVAHSTLELEKSTILEGISRETGVARPPVVELSGGLREWKKEVASWKGKEGVVLTLPSGAMIKLKSDSYLELHRMTTAFSLRQTKRLILTKQLYSREAFTNFLTEAGADWETVQSLQPLILATEEAHRRALTTYPQLTQRVDVLCIQMRGKRGSLLAELNKLSNEAERQVALLYLDGREQEAEHALGRFLIEGALEKFDEDLSI